MTHDVTVSIASIPPRAKMLARALASVTAQTLQPAAIVVEIDHDRVGSVATKNRALTKVDTEWTAFLDDDDQFLPEHLEKLRRAAERTGADVVYPIPVRVGAPDILLRFGLPFCPDSLRRGNYIPTTSLVRTRVAQRAGGFQLCTGQTRYNDWGLYLAMLDAGAKFVHLPERTWVWNIHGGNTSGQPTRW